MRLFRRKKHVHTPQVPWAIGLLRANVLMYGGTLHWRCVCGEMVEDKP